MLGAMVEEYPVGAAPGDQAPDQPDAGDAHLDHAAVDRRGEALVQPHQGPLASGPVRNLGRELPYVVGGQLRLEVVEEALPPHSPSVVTALTYSSTHANVGKRHQMTLQGVVCQAVHARELGALSSRRRERSSSAEPPCAPSRPSVPRPWPPCRSR